LRFSQQQIHAPILNDDNALLADIVQHLQENAPDVVKAYPPGYFLQLVRHSALLARDGFGLHDVQAIRLFVSLRWDIGAGYYHHPTINAVLSDHTLPAMARFEKLLSPEHEDVWLDAAAFDGPEYWRGAKSSGFVGEWTGDGRV
jgi:predicted ATPase